MKSISILPLLSATAYAMPDPTPAPAPHELIERQIRQNTNYFSIYETAIPNDASFMGIGAGIFPDGGTTNYWIGCTRAAYTTSGGYAGCGRDDFYTTCSGNVAKAKDGTDITCVTSAGFACQTAEIFDDLDTKEYVSWIKCGVRGEKTQLVRTPTGSRTTLSGVTEATGLLIDSREPTTTTKGIGGLVTDTPTTSRTGSLTTQSTTTSSSAAGAQNAAASLIALAVPALAVVL